MQKLVALVLALVALANAVAGTSDQTLPGVLNVGAEELTNEEHASDELAAEGVEFLPMIQTKVEVPYVLGGQDVLLESADAMGEIVADMAELNTNDGSEIVASTNYQPTADEEATLAEENSPPSEDTETHVISGLEIGSQVDGSPDADEETNANVRNSAVDAKLEELVEDYLETLDIFTPLLSAKLEEELVFKLQAIRRDPSKQTDRLRVDLLVRAKDDLPDEERLEMAERKMPLDGDKAARAESLKDSLKGNSQASQRPILDVLENPAMSTNFVKFQSLWITNSILIEGATLELIQAIGELDVVLTIEENVVVHYTQDLWRRELTAEEVHDVRARQRRRTTTIRKGNGKGELDAHKDSSETPHVQQSWRQYKYPKVEWNLVKIGADEVHANGIMGEGIIVGGIDTGVRWTHEALIGNYLNNGKNNHDYAWFDPIGISPDSPSDVDGHGTHTLAIAVGPADIGVAPKSKWIACRGCTKNGCKSGDLLACGEWMLCPTKTDGTGGCGTPPDVINNSWGGDPGATWFYDMAEAWNLAGIIPIFSAGNNGDAGCSTMTSPGDQRNVISVGASTPSDSLATYSSKGPPVQHCKSCGVAKPDLVAPGGDSTDVGYGIRSAYHVSDTAYALIAGTSMASPHVAGAVALVANAGNYTSGLDFFKLRAVLTETTTREDLVRVEPDCGTSAQWWEGSEEALNYNFGAGRLDLFAAVNASTAMDLQKHNRGESREMGESPWDNLNVLKELFGETSPFALGILGLSLLVLIAAMLTMRSPKESERSDKRRGSYGDLVERPYPLIQNYEESGYGSTKNNQQGQHRDLEEAVIVRDLRPSSLSARGLSPPPFEGRLQRSPSYQTEQHLINPFDDEKSRTQRMSAFSDSEVMQLAAFGFSLQAAVHSLEKAAGDVEEAIQQLSVNAEPAAALGIRFVVDDDVLRVTAAGFSSQAAVHALELCGDSTAATKFLLRQS